MMFLKLNLRCLLMSLSFSTLGAYGIDNVTNPIKDDFTQVISETKSEPGLSEDEEVLEKWKSIEKIIKATTSQAVKSILPSILHSSEEMNISPKCASSFMKMIFGLKNMKLWAFRMLDSFGKIPNGVLNGFLSSLGDFDGCLSINVPGSDPFRGEYCSIFIKPPLPERVPFHDVDDVLPLFVNFTKKGTVIDEVVRQVHNLHYVSLRTSVCVPSTCSREDVQKIAENVVALTKLKVEVSVPTCDVEEPLVFSTAEIIIIFILCFLGLLVFVATAIDVYLNIFNKENRQKVMSSSTGLKCLMCFSGYSNTLMILKEDNSPHSIKAFHGMKVITMLWVMLNHNYFYINFNLSGSLLNVREFGKEYAFQVVSNAYLSVEAFFFISAVLLAYGRMKSSENSINIPTYIYRRVWRLTPPHMLFIATTMLVPHMGSGPGWKETVNDLVDQCRTTWWRNLIFINNLLDYKTSCYAWLWYIAADTQLYILALFIMIPIKSRPRLALGLNASLFIIGIITTAAAHVYYNQTPTVIYAFLHPDDWNYYVDYSHLRCYTHITACCFGLYVGWLLAEKPNVKIPRVLNVFGWLGFLILALICVYGVYDWCQGNIPGLAVSALYVCASRVVWNLALSYVTIACFTGNGGVIASILSWYPFVPLARLTYVAYLIHPIFQYMYIGSTRIPIPMDHRTSVYRYIANVVISYSFAYIVSLLFECPFMGLERIMFSKRSSSQPTANPKPKANGKNNNQPEWPEGSVSILSVNKCASEKL